MKITSIKLKNSKGEFIEIDFEDAKALYKQLDSIFAEKVVINNQPTIVWPRNYPSPIYGDPYKPTLFDDHVITSAIG